MPCSWSPEVLRCFGSGPPHSAPVPSLCSGSLSRYSGGGLGWGPARAEDARNAYASCADGPTPSLPREYTGEGVRTEHRLRYMSRLVPTRAGGSSPDARVSTWKETKSWPARQTARPFTPCSTASRRPTRVPRRRIPRPRRPRRRRAGAPRGCAVPAARRAGRLRRVGRLSAGDAHSGVARPARVDGGAAAVSRALPNRRVRAGAARGQCVVGRASPGGRPAPEDRRSGARAAGRRAGAVRHGAGAVRRVAVLVRRSRRPRRPRRGRLPAGDAARRGPTRRVCRRRG